LFLFDGSNFLGIFAKNACKTITILEN